MQRSFLRKVVLTFNKTTQQRSFHESLIASSKKSTTSADFRLAGRMRFYKQVGVAPVSAPWETTKNDDAGNKNSSIESPISAGVDGTSSASGVHHLNGNNSESLQWMLSPRRPGTTTTNVEEYSWYGITLDGRTVKTPMGQTLAVPSEGLAHAIAAEWDAQAKLLQPANMPLMTLACTVLDQAAYHPGVYREQSLNFLPTDTTCFWTDPTEDRVLHRRQEQAWQDLHDFVKEKFDHAPAFAMGASEGMLMARKRGDKKPFAGLPHPSPLLDQAKRWTDTLDAWHLVALHSLCSQAKSFLVAFCVLEPESPYKDLKKAIEASRVEEEFQISVWGLVEGGHDYDRLNCSIQLISAKMFVQTILSENPK